MVAQFCKVSDSASKTELLFPCTDYVSYRSNFILFIVLVHLRKQRFLTYERAKRLKKKLHHPLIFIFMFHCLFDQSDHQEWYLKHL
jgi:hypothetical protein